MSADCSPPVTIESLQKLIESFNKNNVDYYLIGGFALLAHGYERATTDIDIIVPATVESGEKIIRSLLVLKDKAAKDIDPQWFSDDGSENFGTIRVADEVVVDIMFNACGETFESLKQHEETIVVNNSFSVRTINLEGLLKTKQSMRDKDQPDRLILMRAIEEIKKGAKISPTKACLMILRAN